jgi:hypothetical protein
MLYLDKIINIFRRNKKQWVEIPKPYTPSFINFLLVNALRNLTEEQRHELTISLVTRDNDRSDIYYRCPENYETRKSQ